MAVWCLKRPCRIVLLVFLYGLVIHRFTRQVSLDDKNEKSSPLTTNESADLIIKTKIILVLFTTVKNTSDAVKLFIYSNTIYNWASFVPSIQPVLFTSFNTGPLINLAKEQGWIISPVLKTNKYGTPYVKEMYERTMEMFDADFYAYSNGDLLYDQGLIDTLDSVRQRMNVLKPVMVAGMRWNYYLENDLSVYGVDPLWKPDKATKLAGPRYSKLHSEMSKDYFIVTRDFPWANFTNVVIGRMAIDNYLVGRAIQLNVSVVDATHSIANVHQVGRDGLHTGRRNRDGQFNKGIIGDFDLKSGNISKSQWIAKHLYNHVDIVKR